MGLASGCPAGQAPKCGCSAGQASQVEGTEDGERRGGGGGRGNEITVEDVLALPFRERAPAVLAAEVVKLVSANWLLQAPKNFIMARCQELPAEAFVEGERASRLFEEPKGIVVVSYGWLTRKHPDPKGFYLRIIRGYLKKHMKLVRLDDVALFWDFASLPQPGPDGIRTSVEQKQIELALMVVDSFYAAQFTVVIQIKQMLDPFIDSDGNTSNQTPYDLRGWCFFEETVSCFLKPHGHILDLSLVAQEILDGTDTWNIDMASRAPRKPPLVPDSMIKQLSIRSFTNGNDKDMVGQIYADCVQTLGSLAVSLVFSDMGEKNWGDDEMKACASFLQFFPKARDLKFQCQLFGDEGLFALIAVLPKLKYLEVLGFIDHVNVTSRGWKALVDILPTLPKLMYLQVKPYSAAKAHSVNANVIQAFIDVLPSLSKLRSLHVTTGVKPSNHHNDLALAWARLGKDPSRLLQTVNLPKKE